MLSSFFVFDRLPFFRSEKFTDDIQLIWNHHGSVEQYQAKGGTSTNSVLQQIKELKDWLDHWRPVLKWKLVDWKLITQLIDYKILNFCIWKVVFVLHILLYLKYYFYQHFTCTSRWSFFIQSKFSNKEKISVPSVCKWWFIWLINTHIRAQNDFFFLPGLKLYWNYIKWIWNAQKTRERKWKPCKTWNDSSLKISAIPTLSIWNQFSLLGNFKVCFYAPFPWHVLLLPFHHSQWRWWYVSSATSLLNFNLIEKVSMNRRRKVVS